MRKSWIIIFSFLAVMALAGSLQAWMFARAKVGDQSVGGSYEPTGKAPGTVDPLLNFSPGDSLDYTFYDAQQNCGIGRMIVMDHVGSHGLHICYTKSLNVTHNPCNVYYQYNDRAGSGWSGGLPVSTARSGYPNIAVFSNGRAVIAFQQAPGGRYRSTVAVDTTSGGGSFTLVDIDTVTFPPGNCPLWPRVTVGPTDVIEVVAKHATINELYRSRSTDRGAHWTPWAQVTGDTMVGTVCQDVTTGPSGKVAIAWTQSINGSAHSQRNCDVYYVESTDYGATWGAPVNVTQYQASDTVRAYCDVSGLYDANGLLNLAWSGERVIGDTAYFNAAAIFHWRQGSGSIHLVSGQGNVNGTFWWDQDKPMGIWKLGCDRPSLAMDSTGYLYCVWTGQLDMPSDTGADGYPNGDLFGCASFNSGWYWSTSGNLTFSHTPGAGPGACSDDDYPSIVSFAPDSVRILWIEDRDAGNSLQGEGATVSCPVKYLALSSRPDTDEVERDRVMGTTPEKVNLGPSRPNPFRKTTDIEYALPDAREVNLTIFNIQGQLVKTLVSEAEGPGYHVARWDASSMPAGVYLYRLRAGEFAKTRAMVVVK